jgi:exopolyphosphatase / guanosine-5'-triphosphate,3'-diphosphate pyrophosphatase
MPETLPLAIIDLGTNTFHLLVAEPLQNGKWKKILQERVTVKLGEGGMGNKTIAPVPYKRGMKALEKFRKELDRLHIEQVDALGTAALRDSKNGTQFINEAAERFNIKIRLITGQEEAKLICLGVRRAVKIKSEKALIMDIGGGSVEFIISDSQNIYWKQSYKLGAALLIEKFRPSDPVTEKEIKKLSRYFSTILKSLVEATVKYNPSILIGSAGSFETLASMIRHRFPESGSHYGKTEHPIDINHFYEIHKKIVNSTKNERLTMKGLVTMRVDMIVMASLLIKFVLELTGINKIKLSSYALKEGALQALMERKRKK